MAEKTMLIMKTRVALTQVSSTYNVSCQWLASFWVTKRNSWLEAGNPSLCDFFTSPKLPKRFIKGTFIQLIHTEKISRFSALHRTRGRHETSPHLPSLLIGQGRDRPTWDQWVCTRRTRPYWLRPRWYLMNRCLGGGTRRSQVRNAGAAPGELKRESAIRSWTQKRHHRQIYIYIYRYVDI